MTRQLKIAVTLIVTTWALAILSIAARAAGTLTPVGSTNQPIQILDHHVNVVINNGFAQTEVTQRFFNPNSTDVEAIFRLPLPKDASLSEMTIYAGESELNGEVLAKKDADRIYEEEKASGNDAGKAEKNGIQSFDFYVAKVPAQNETRVRFVYYQPLEIDHSIGRYVYPLEAGGTDEAASQFWQPTNTKVEGNFSIVAEVKSVIPLQDVRMPGFEGDAVREAETPDFYRIRIERPTAELTRDFVLYYRFADDLPGSVELSTFRPDASKPGTFMMTITPAVDLQPIQSADYVYVLDTSGSMSGGKIQTLANGIEQALGKMRPEDRFRVITFSSSAQELTGWQQATEPNIRAALQRVKALNAGGSTNLYDAMQMALTKLDDDRATSIVLVTDAVTNTGIVEPRAFDQLLAQYDIRVFGFLIGNSGNWPLMNLMTETTGGFAASVSNADDIIGQILQAKDKITFESLHDVDVKISGVKTFDVTGDVKRKVYRGQQLVVFGKYDGSGPATVKLRARLTGEDKEYTTRFDFPETDTSSPEIERLWALTAIQEAEMQRDRGLLPASESDDIALSLGVEYQIVTDQTSMVVLSDEAFARRNIERRNQARVAVERAAQSQRQSQPAVERRVDTNQPMFSNNRPRLGGGGAIDPVALVLILPLLVAAAGALRKLRPARN